MRSIFASLVLIIAGLLGYFLRKRKPDAPVRVGQELPQQISRNDFSATEKSWIVLVFTSSTCDACKDVARKALVLESKEVGVQIIDYVDNQGLHKRYQIDSVPTTLISDRDGVVMFATVGPITATDLWAALAKCRD